MAIKTSFLCLFSLLIVGCTTAKFHPKRITTDLTYDWRFIKGDQPDGVVQVEFDDSGWESVRLPHDWAISGPFNPKENGYSGKLPWRGVGWYRRVIHLDETLQGKQVYLDFDGVMAHPSIYVNGQLAGGWDYGYMSFRIDITPFVQFGQDNVIAIKVDTTKQGTRWYPGAGIYRDVEMVVNDPVHIEHWGTFVTTPEISSDSATVHVSTELVNHTDVDQVVILTYEILNPSGNRVCRVERGFALEKNNTQTAEQDIVLNDPHLWDVDDPALYALNVTTMTDTGFADSDCVNFGVRTIEFKANDGFHLNGRRVELKGVNLHHDHGPLGAAYYPRAMERQLEIMKGMGVNALRTSHNPPSGDVLDLCDRMGIVVWDECFDKWDDKAGRVNNEPPLKPYCQKQIVNFVKRDRNHPSVVIWSIGNEIGNVPYDSQGKSPDRIAFLRNCFLAYDQSRPVGMGCFIPSTVNEPILDTLDLTGWNYNHRYDRYRETYPDKPILYSESASALSTRGFYALPLPTGKTDYHDETHEVSSYDFNAARWSDIADVEFDLMRKDRFVGGEFVWTGFDYLGEPTPFGQDARSSYFGIVDLCGIPKDRFYLYRSYWKPDETTVHILPHWNWGKEYAGQAVPVFVYTNGDEAELFLNGKSLGRRKKGDVPKGTVNYALGQSVKVSTEQEQNVASSINDGNWDSRWCASSSDVNQWIVVDLGESQGIGFIHIQFESGQENYGYDVLVSEDGEGWQEIVSVKLGEKGSSGDGAFNVTSKGRYLKVVFNELAQGRWASIREIQVSEKAGRSSYYDSIYNYRLCWFDVPYEEGRLTVVAYRDGEEIGTAEMVTAGEVAGIKLTPDRVELAADGWDLCYVLVEAVDQDGNLCPLADDKIEFEIAGPAEIVGVGNGNPLSLEPFQANYRKLFYGKAMLIVRTMKGQAGEVTITARGDGLDSSVTVIKAK